MKKILLLSSLVIIMFSCSNENEITNTQENTNIENISKTASKQEPIIENEIDIIFYEYTNSDEYKDYQERLFTFYDKLNLNDENTTTFIESEVLIWINENIESTSFVNFDNAKSEYEQLSKLKEIKMTKFSNITKFVQESDFVVVKYYFNKWLRIVKDYNTIYSNCLEDFDYCNERADNDFYSALGDAMSGADNGTKNTLIMKAETYYLANLGYCQRTFDKCIGLRTF